MSKRIVISAVNIRVGGTLTILRECLAYLSGCARANDYEVTAVVHKRSLAHFEGIRYIEYPQATASWLNRLKIEYAELGRLSRRLPPIDLWLSLHDTTPAVAAKRQAVYCHNPFPFYKWNLHSLLMNPKLVLFSMSSKQVYRANIHRNRYVVVQQQWLRQAFEKMFALPADKIIVARPFSPQPHAGSSPLKASRQESYRFVYASKGEMYKNFETLLQAARLLEARLGRGRFTVAVTLDGNENRYTRWLRRRWGDVESVEFVGFLGRQELQHEYDRAQCMVFPSVAETWGLPITEFGASGKPVLVADLDYAHETTQGLERVAFFAPRDPAALADLMEKMVAGDYTSLHRIPSSQTEPPCTNSWAGLFSLLLK